MKPQESEKAIVFRVAELISYSALRFDFALLAHRNHREFVTPTILFYTVTLERPLGRLWMIS